MKANEPVVLRRDCEAIQIPSGYKLMLPAGSEVMITQSLGGSFTVVTDHGNMLRIASNDADALGLGIGQLCRLDVTGDGGFEARMLIGREASHMGATMLVADYQRIRLRAVDETEGHAGI